MTRVRCSSLRETGVRLRRSAKGSSRGHWLTADGRFGLLRRPTGEWHVFVRPGSNKDRYVRDRQLLADCRLHSQTFRTRRDAAAAIALMLTFDAKIH